MYADIKYKDGTQEKLPLSSEVLEVYRDSVHNQYSQEVYKTKHEQAKQYIQEKTDKEIDMLSLEPEREDITQYLLDQGIGITYLPDNAETTQAEMNRFGTTRYVSSEQIDYFVQNEAYVADSPKYAVISEMAMLDFDEWNALAETVQSQLTYDEAFYINNLLWVNYDLSPLDIQIDKDAVTIKEAIGQDDLSSKIEQAIYKILSEKPDNKLKMSCDCKQNKKKAEKYDRTDD